MIIKTYGYEIKIVFLSDYCKGEDGNLTFVYFDNFKNVTTNN